MVVLVQCVAGFQTVKVMEVEDHTSVSYSCNLSCYDKN